MKVIYDSDTDTLTIIFSESPVSESDDAKQGTILDFDDSGNLIAIEILEASKRVTVPTHLDYQVLTKPAA